MSGLPVMENATQTVFGEGPADAQIMFVGEQPATGKTATAVRLSGRRAAYWTGRWRRRASIAAASTRPMQSSISSSSRGEAPAAQRPNAGEIKICRHWLLDEIEAIGPRLIVALGATAAQSLAGRAIPVAANRGRVLDVASGVRVFVTIHPSALLRLEDEEAGVRVTPRFVDDLRSVERLAKASAGKTKAPVHAGE